MANVKLKNVAKERTFVIGDGNGGDIRLAPGQVAEVSAAEAERLMEIYPNELVDSSKVKETPVNAAPAAGETEDAFEKMSVVELKAALKAKGIEHKSNAPKADLIALLKAAPAANTPNLVEPTPVPADPAAPLTEGVVYQDANGLYVGTIPAGETVVKLLPVASLTDEQRAKLVSEGKLAAA